MEVLIEVGVEAVRPRTAAVGDGHLREAVHAYRRAYEARLLAVCLLEVEQEREARARVVLERARAQAAGGSVGPSFGSARRGWLS